ncbi:MAG TPA: hypothetical protein VHU89_11210 [Acidobacteriaceae bacterium]|jgi:hypothetical protein|nr:hypothetical protein [Acidobacteriaceae bacterium]
MRRLLLLVLVSALASRSSCLASSTPDRDHPGSTSAAATAAPAADTTTSVTAVPSYLPPMPAAPQGRSTVIGGVIRDVDPLQDEMSLKVYGGHPMNILFDARTRVYRDGVQTPLSDLHPQEHASVETVLDGDNIFALSVHMLTHAPEGNCQGQVLGFDPRDGDLTVRNSLSGQTVHLRIPANTPIQRVGQESFSSSSPGASDLMHGALLSIQFQADNQGGGVADHIAILATPGAVFQFAGDVTYLDMHAAEMAIRDSQDQKNYTIDFDPARFPQSRQLHVGSHVVISASFSGRHYVADNLTIR